LPRGPSTGTSPSPRRCGSPWPSATDTSASSLWTTTACPQIGRTVGAWRAGGLASSA
jgi:hypothetical protein